MNFAVIAPTENLPTLCAGRPVQMCLAPFCNDYRYFEFYKAESLRPGCTVILDNGAWENKLMHTKEYIELAEELKPQIVVVPDVLNDTAQTEQKCQAFLNCWDRGWAIQLMYVPQARHDSMFQDGLLLSAYRWGLEKGFTHFGISRAIQNRVKFIHQSKKLQLWNPTYYHHALGMQAGNFAEIYLLVQEGINSFDSSRPVWRLVEPKEDFNPKHKLDEMEERLAKTVIDQIDNKLKWELRSAS